MTPADTRTIDRYDPAVIRRRALATADFHERVAGHLSERGRQGEAERAGDAAWRLRGGGVR